MRKTILGLLVTLAVASSAYAVDPTTSLKRTRWLESFTTNGYIGAWPSASDPVTCNSTNKRSEYYNTASNVKKLCDSSVWRISAWLNPPTATDLGTTTTPYRFLYFYGAGTYATTYFKLTGTPTSTRTVTFPDATDTVAELGQAQTFTATNTYSGLVVNTPQSFTVADNGGGTAATGTLTPTSNVILVTCSDTDGCTITMGETGMVSGTLITIVNMSANAAAFADTSGVSETTGAISLGQYDSLRFVYATDRWVMLSTSNN